MTAELQVVVVAISQIEDSGEREKGRGKEKVVAVKVLAMQKIEATLIA